MFPDESLVIFERLYLCKESLADMHQAGINIYYYDDQDWAGFLHSFGKDVSYNMNKAWYYIYIYIYIYIDTFENVKIIIYICFYLNRYECEDFIFFLFPSHADTCI